VDELLEEMAYGFKWLVSDNFDELDVTANPKKVFFDVLRIAMVYLSKRMVARYNTYSPEPKDVWLDLHQLYELVEKFRKSDAEFQKSSQAQLVSDVIHAYLRIVMLSITNPYHLMQGEAQLIYTYLNKWVSGCRIISLHGYIIDKGDLIIDLDRDISPQFVYQDNFPQPLNFRSIDMSSLMKRFKETIAGLTTRKESAGGVVNSNMTFNERMRRDMLFRLQTVWKDRLQRGSPRTISNEKLRLVSSLSASHFFIDGQQDFYPESDEVRVHKPERKLATSADTLSLMPIDYEPWKEDKAIDIAETDIERKRISLFNDDMDIWEKIFASKSHARALHEKHAVLYKDHMWKQINTSHNGMGLRYEASENARVSVGNVVAFHPNDTEQWCLGVVTWMKEFSINRFDMGVRIITGAPQAVAVRAISGTGCGSEYFRGLLLTTGDVQNQVTRLLVPASMYDVGTQVVMNFRDRLKYVQLTDMMRTTTCFSMFCFKDIEIPSIELHKIHEIKSA